MAEILKTFTFRRNGDWTRYPWAEWLDGKIRRLTRGKDFAIDLEHFRISCHNAARSRKLIVHTQRDNKKSIVIQAVPRNGVNGKQRP